MKQSFDFVGYYSFRSKFDFRIPLSGKPVSLEEAIKTYILGKTKVSESGVLPMLLRPNTNWKEFVVSHGIGNEFDVYPFTDNNVCTQIAYIKYVHQLQHLLFGLGINHEMEV
jgi:hypothetical protein